MKEKVVQPVRQVVSRPTASQSNAATQSQPKSMWQQGWEWVKEKVVQPVQQMVSHPTASQSNAATQSQPKSPWQRGWEWIRKPINYGTILGGIIGGVVGGLTMGVPGFIGGMAVGATAGALWGSNQQGYIRTVRELLSNPWATRRPARFPPIKQATGWLVETMKANANGPIAETLRQTHKEMGPLGWLVTVPNWIALVQRDGPWDFKPDQRKKWKEEDLTKPMKLAGLQVRRDVFSNVHYGYVGRSIGYPRWLLELGAGLAQIKDEPSKWWSNWRSGFDEPVDKAAINAGVDLYEQYTAQGKPIDEAALQEVLQRYPDLLCNPTSGTRTIDLEEGCVK